MLVEMAIFDAYGAGFEYTHPKFLARNHRLRKYVQHPRHKSVRPGHYTDDTQMAIGIAEAMLSVVPNEWTPFHLVFALTNTFARDPRDGYAKGFHQILTDLSKVTAAERVNKFFQIIRPHSEKNGGAMRAGPLGVLPHVQDVKSYAMWQASFTHGTLIGMGAAAASALMVHYLYHQIGPKKDLPAWLDDHVPGFFWKHPFQGHVGSRANEAVAGALWAIVNSDTLMEVLDRCVSYGGDTDTVAAIAGIAASCSAEIAQFLPIALHEGLEDGDYGRSWLDALDARLIAAYPPKVHEPVAAFEEGSEVPAYDEDVIDLISDLFG